MSKIMKMDMSNGHKLCVCLNTWSDEYPDEFCTYIEDENGIILQDIAIIRECLTKSGTYTYETIEALIYADEYNEDYTHKFKIREYDFEEDK